MQSREQNNLTTWLYRFFKPTNTTTEPAPSKDISYEERLDKINYPIALIPDEYLCAINHTVVNNPIQLICTEGGACSLFELSALEEWWDRSKNRNNPINREIITDREVRKVINIENAIIAFIERQEKIAASHDSKQSIRQFEMNVGFEKKLAKDVYERDTLLNLRAYYTETLHTALGINTLPDESKHSFINRLIVAAKYYLSLPQCKEHVSQKTVEMDPKKIEKLIKEIELINFKLENSKHLSSYDIQKRTYRLLELNLDEKKVKEEIENIFNNTPTHQGGSSRKKEATTPHHYLYTKSDLHQRSNGLRGLFHPRTLEAETSIKINAQSRIAEH